MTHRIQQNESFSAAPHAVYELLTNGEKFSAMSGGASADIDAAEGGRISLFGGAITGMTIEADEPTRIVQAWRPGPWEAGAYSLVRFDIEAEGDGCVVRLDHSGFPDDQGEHLAQGWVDNYWAPMHAALG